MKGRTEFTILDREYDHNGTEKKREYLVKIRFWTKRPDIEGEPSEYDVTVWKKMDDRRIRM